MGKFNCHIGMLPGLHWIVPLAALNFGNDFVAGGEGQGFNGLAHFSVSDQGYFHGAVRVGVESKSNCRLMPVPQSAGATRA